MMLTFAPTTPRWIALFPDVGDGKSVEVEFAAIDIRAVRAARRAVAAALNVDAADYEQAGDELSRELIRRGIRAWRGIGDEKGKPIEVTPHTIEAFIADPRTFEAADRLYVIPWVRLDTEGNASSASPGGTGRAATRGAATAKRSASTGRKGGAARPKAKREKAAPISPKPSRRRTLTPSGT